jgi:predicted ArsR family transcriptional regulator
LVSDPEPQHRNSPGRPRYVYRLTEKANALFPGNLNTLTTHILGELQSSLSSSQINVIFDGVVGRMAEEFDADTRDEPITDRLDRVVAHLSGHGYEAAWESHTDGYLLHTCHCPYGEVAEAHDSVCQLDVRYISHLLGIVPRRMAHITDGDHACSYLIQDHSATFEAAG